MAHSGSEIHEFDYFEDENGKLIPIIPHTEIKEEPSMTSNDIYSQHSESGVYNQHGDSSSGFIRMPNNYNIQQHSSYTTVVPPHTTSSGRTIKYTNPNMTMKSNEAKVHKFIVNSNSSQSQTSKSKPSTVQSSISRRRKPDKVGKGLRHFSMKVCEKVREKVKTTYNEVADELVSEEVQNQTTYDSANCDQKNIRRRVYDALNVLMAMNIISKDKKEIRWIGLPSNSMQQCSTLELENQKRRERVEQKRQQLRELLLQQVSFKSLVDRNREAEKQGIIPTQNSSIQLPFIIVNTHKQTKVNCSVSTDKSEYYFKFNDKFEIHDDVEVMKRMGLLYGLDKGECSYEDIEKAKTMVPKNFEKYIEAYGRGQQDIDSDEWSSYCNMVDKSQVDARTRNQSSEPIEILEEEELISESSDVD